MCESCLAQSKKELTKIEVYEDDHPLNETDLEEKVTNEWQQLFFQHQKENMVKSSNRRRYHPDIIRWAIEFYCRSPAAYEHVRSSGALILPSASTIRQYRNCFNPKPGISLIALQEMDRLQMEHKYLPSYITLDEMKVRENLVNKQGQLVGFVEGIHGTDAKLASHILDGLSINRRFFKLISGHATIPLDKYFTAPNPFTLNDRVVFLCSDSSHLLKTARNSLFQSRPSGTKYMNMNGHDILWNHILQLYETEKGSPLLSRTRLSEAHVKLNPFSKMKVGLAKDTLSWKVGQCLKLMPNAEGTANYVLMFDRWFDIINCKASYPIRHVNDERLQWLQDEFIEKLIKWEEEVKNKHGNQRKRIIAYPTLEGLIFTSRNMIGLCKQLLQLDCLEYVCLHTFTQDVLEAFFGNVRSHGGRSTNPDISQVAYSIQHITQRKIIKKIKGGNTTHGAQNPWTSVCHSPMPKRAKF
uniref:uncharacterized protein LOC108949295 n=1 Tax=Ciona intestinalis TaxID=7719 RepID=UPI000EF4F4F9|nr:uncharacterized protein LOC108949295 [Ciona intestinalis]|eukprot:XP_026695248.1 uncharacterized protein LOC108949295 [Ciona intestinalis]